MQHQTNLQNQQFVSVPFLNYKLWLTNTIYDKFINSYG